MYRYHIFVCINQRSPEDLRGCCAAKGSANLRELFKLEIKKRGWKAEVRANTAGCLDKCEFGPSVVIYPEGVWYTVRTEHDVLEILDRHIGKGEVVERLLMAGQGQPSRLGNGVV
ncbi:MAG TPA: (2Fe-2S) ferredoxin domain-containing protein [Acidobacteriota bacterium]|jgi:(2Fe-2S) ferredoxin|nr:(2Fe-2S) ferredoxin domain-containing protein [Acidobacteriota bacterium]